MIKEMFFHKWSVALIVTSIAMLGNQLYAQTPSLIHSQTFSASGSGATGVPAVTVNIPEGTNRMMVVSIVLERNHSSNYNNNPLPEPNTTNIQTSAQTSTGTYPCTVLRSRRYTTGPSSDVRFSFHNTLCYLREADGLTTGNTTLTFTNLNLPKGDSDEMSVIVSVYEHVKSISDIAYTGEQDVTGYRVASTSGTAPASPVGRLATDILYLADGASSKSSLLSLSSGWTVPLSMSNVIMNNKGNPSWGGLSANEPDGISHRMGYQTYSSGNPSVTFTRANSGSIERGTAYIYALMPFAKPSVTGTVYIDNNGLDDGINDGGTGGGVWNTANSLFVNAVDANGYVVATAAVNNVGVFTFLSSNNNNNWIEGDIIHFQLSKNQGTIGQPAPAKELPDSWSTVGESTSSGPSDANPDGEFTLTIGDTDSSNNITNRFGVNSCKAGTEQVWLSSRELTNCEATIDGPDLKANAVINIPLLFTLGMEGTGYYSYTNIGNMPTDGSPIIITINKPANQSGNINAGMTINSVNLGNSTLIENVHYTVENNATCYRLTFNNTIVGLGETIGIETDLEFNIDLPQTDQVWLNTNISDNSGGDINNTNNEAYAWRGFGALGRLGPNEQSPDFVAKNRSNQYGVYNMPIECCPKATSVNLNSLLDDGIPKRAKLVWFRRDLPSDDYTGSHTEDEPVTDPTHVTESGFYTAFFFDEENDCYNTDKSTSWVIVTILPPCNYWHGTIDTDWGTANNWTGGFVPENYKDIEFATEENNPTIEGVPSSGPAKEDLHLDKDRIIGDLINKSETNKNLVVTVGNELRINGEVWEDNTGIIVVKADSLNKKTNGTLILNPDIDTNKSAKAIVEFYNKAYECDDCGFYRQQWQYFGIPVQQAAFPYRTPRGEIVNQWVEPYNGDKWRPAPVAPDTHLKAFKGYQITNTEATDTPDHIYRFDGTLNVGNAYVMLTKTPSVNYSGANLIGNSYTAAIPIATGLSFSTEIADKAVYLFNTGTRDQWRKLNGSTATGVASGKYLSVPFHLARQPGLPAVIPSMHSFMIFADPATTLTIDYKKLEKNQPVKDAAGNDIATRSAGNNPQNRDVPAVQQLPALVMDVVGEKSADRVWVFSKSGTTHGFDSGWDGRKMEEDGITQLYVSGSDDSKLQVATVPDMNNVTLGFVPDSDGRYTLEFSLSGQLKSAEIQLYDEITKTNERIHDGGSYSFEAKKGETPNRFRLTYGAPLSQLSPDEKLIEVTATDDGKIIIENRSNNDCSAFISGKGAPRGRIEMKAGGKEAIEGLSAGIYIIRLQNAVITDVRRVTIK